jgi:predicted metal-dependent peptidase
MSSIRKNTELTDEYSERIEVARMAMLREFPFFAHLALSADIWISDDLPEHALAGTDGLRIYMQPDFMRHPDLTMADIVSVISHEVMHLALRHTHKRKYRNPMRWNIAADCIVNEFLKIQGLQLPGDTIMEGGSWDFEQLASQFGITGLVLNDTSAADIYAMIPDHVGQQQQASGDCNQESTENAGLGQCQPGSGEDQSGNNSPGDGGGGEIKVHPDILEPAASEHGEEADQKKWEQAMQGAVSKLDKQKFGSLPGFLRRALGITEDKMALDWEHILGQFVSRTVSDSRTYRRPSKRWAYRDRIRATNLSKVSLAIAVDLSGSVTEQELDLFIAAINSISACNRLSHYRLLAHDTSVTFDEVFRPLDPLPVEIEGGGGTDFRPIFERLEKNQPAGLVWFTDGYGSYPDTPPQYPVIWVINHEEEITPPFGDVIRVPVDQLLDN